MAGLWCGSKDFFCETFVGVVGVAEVIDLRVGAEVLAGVVSRFSKSVHPKLKMSGGCYFTLLTELHIQTQQNNKSE
jgi:hypothetical protein